MAGDKFDAAKFTAADMACMVAFMRQAGCPFGKNEWAIMSAVDGKRSMSSYDHQTRAIRTMATEIQKRMKDGDLKDVSSTPVKKGKAPMNSPTATGSQQKSGAKRGRAAQDGDDDHDDEQETPTKKSKSEKEPSIKPEQSEEDNGLSYEFEFN